MRLRLACSAAIVFGVISATAASAGDATANKPAATDAQQITNFELRDYRGKTWSLDKDAANSKIVVVAFLGTDCPLVKLYSARLEELSTQYRDQGVTFVGINSNRQDPPTKIAAQAQQLGIHFPILKDPDNTVADLFDAERTPEMFVLDQDRVVRYRGRIDDQYGFSTGVGYAKKAITRRDLVEAIDDLAAGREVAVARTDAPGCLIGRVPKVTPHGDVTYSNQIARILNNRCVQCHREGQIGPMPLTSYDEVLGWGEMMRRGGQCQPHAPLARQSRARIVQQRREPDATRKRPDQHLGRERFARGQP